jgi:peptidoglycan hydrolase-like protein with peptidoglycan-binding domain
MKHLLGAVAAVSLGFGLAVSGAHAQGAQGGQTMQGGQPMHGGQTTNQHQMSRHAASRTSPVTREAQSRLKEEGLYHGRIDGVVGPQTRRAIANFQRKHGLHESARLDQQTRKQLLGSQAVGVGSSAPATHQRSSHPSGSFTKESGSGSNNAPGQSTSTPPVTPPTSPSANGAGGSNPSPPSESGGSSSPGH